MKNKPCPFCASANIKTQYDNGIFKEQCQNCFATGPALVKQTTDVIDWNTRLLTKRKMKSKYEWGDMLAEGRVGVGKDLSFSDFVHDIQQDVLGN